MVMRAFLCGSMYVSVRESWLQCPLVSDCLTGEDARAQLDSTSVRSCVSAVRREFVGWLLELDQQRGAGVRCSQAGSSAAHGSVSTYDIHTKLCVWRSGLVAEA